MEEEPESHNNPGMHISQNLGRRTRESQREWEDFGSGRGDKNSEQEAERHSVYENRKVLHDTQDNTAGVQLTLQQLSCIHLLHNALSVCAQGFFY